MKNTVKVGVGLYLFNNKGQVLLGLRRNSHGDGSWAPPGGHLEFGESNAEAAVREAKEETGLDVPYKSVKLAHVTNDFFKDLKKHYITLHLIARIEDGEPKLTEPNKCERWQWFDLNNLPDTLFLSTANFLSEYDLSKNAKL